MTERISAVTCALLVAACSSSSGPSCPEPAPGELPTDVFCIGLYDGGDVTKTSTGVMAYEPGVKLWSDGAEKHRYLFLPPGTQIDTSDLDAWKFPVGTKAFKEFALNGALVETRMMWKTDAATWKAATYIWDDAGGATLNTDPHGVIRPDGYEIPTQKDCDKCHHGGSDKLLGVEAVALALPTAKGATLTELAQRGLLTVSPPVTSVVLPEDVTGKAGAALGYLHANCGMPCHSSRGLGEETQLVMRLRATELFGATPTPVDMLDTYRATVNQMPTTAAVASKFPGANRVIPGAHDMSLIWLLAHRRDSYQMPPLVTHVVDDTGTQQLADWIDALPSS